jgi:LacI family transcriptional regulator
MKIDSVEAAIAWLAEARAKADRPTALFSTNYRVSVLLLRALSERKVVMPSEMAFVGFDDFDLAPAIAPPVTTVGQSAVDLSKKAFRMLFGRIESLGDGVERSPEKIMLPATLIVRGSCGPHS